MPPPYPTPFKSKLSFLQPRCIDSAPQNTSNLYFGYLAPSTMSLAAFGM